jgi:hypothetical protein
MNDCHAIEVIKNPHLRLPFYEFGYPHCTPAVESVNFAQKCGKYSTTIEAQRISDFQIAWSLVALRLYGGILTAFLCLRRSFKYAPGRRRDFLMQRVLA